MALFENFPYTNLHQLNLDWIVKTLKQLKDTIDGGFVVSFNGEQGDVVLTSDWINELLINSVYSTTDNVSTYTQEQLTELFEAGYRTILQENNLHTFDKIFFLRKNNNTIQSIEYNPFSATSGVVSLNGMTGSLTIGANNLPFNSNDITGETIQDKILGTNDIAVWIGDSYVQAVSLGELQSHRFSTKVSAALNVIEKNYAIGGSGYLAPTESTFYDQIQTAITDLTDIEKNNVKYVFIAGGRNDPWLVPSYTLSQLNTAIQSCLSTCRTEFPYAEIIVIPMLWDTIALTATYKTYLYDIMRCLYYTGYTVRTISNGYTYLQGHHDLILTDHVHPNVNGHALIANRVLSSMTGVNDNIPAFYSDTNNGLTITLSRIGQDIQVNIAGTLDNALAFGDQLLSNTLIDPQYGLVTNGPTFITLTGRDGSSCLCQVFFNVNYSRVATVFSIQSLGSMSAQYCCGTAHFINGI